MPGQMHHMISRGRNTRFGLFVVLVWLSSNLLAAQPRPAEVRLCVLSQAVLMRDSAPGRRAMDDLRIARDKMIAELIPAEVQFQAESRLVDQLATTATAGEIQSKREVLRQRRADIDARRESKARELSSYSDRLTALVTQTAGPAINAEERKRNCSILLSREYLLNVADPTLDITSAVLARLNSAAADTNRSKP